MTKRSDRATQVSRAGSRPRSRRIPPRSSFKKRVKTVLALAFLLAETAIAVVFVAFLSFFGRFSAQLPNLESITNDVSAPVATTIWSQDGMLLGSLAVENRQPLPVDKIPKNVANATIAIEDHRFYEHPGVDLQGLVRSAWVTCAASGFARERAP